MSRIEIDGLENYGLVRRSYDRARELIENSERNHEVLFEFYSTLSSSDSKSVDLLKQEVGDGEFFRVLRGAKYGKYKNVKLEEKEDFFVIEPVVIEDKLYRLSWVKELRAYHSYSGKNPIDSILGNIFGGRHARLVDYFASLQLLYSVRDEIILEENSYQKIIEMFRLDFSPKTQMVLDNCLEISNLVPDHYNASKNSGRLTATLEPFFWGVHPISLDLSGELLYSKDCELRKQIFEWFIGHDLTIRVGGVEDSKYLSRVVCLGDTEGGDVKADLSLKNFDYLNRSRKIIITQIDF